MSLSEVVNLKMKSCSDQVNYLILEDPAAGLQMVDSWGKMPDGYLSGSFVHLGNYDQCVNISETSPAGLIRGKYCLVKTADLQQTFRGYSVCVPEVCDLDFPFQERVYCQTKDSFGILDSHDYAFLTVMGIIGFVLVLSTLYDWYTRKYQIKQNPYCILCSMLTNGEKLFETQIGPDQISCLAGLRVLGMIWIIAAHRYYVGQMLVLRNSMYGFNFLFAHESVYVQGAYLAVDTFLYIGGFVLAYQCFKNRNKLALTVPTIPYFYMHRLLRLYPSMIFIFFLSLTVMRRVTSGPLFPYIHEKLREPCADHGWQFFLFIQNYIHIDVPTECLAHTWYLNVDFQLYVATPLILIPATNLLKKDQKKKCYYLFFITLLLSIIIPMLIMFQIPFRYTHSHTRIAPYIMGMIMGLFIVENRDRTFKVGKKLYYFTWTIVFIMASFCAYFMQQTVSNIRHEWDQIVIPLLRPAWGLCLTWLIFCCKNKNTMFLNKFLSNPVFIVMGRLSYSMYMLQALVLLYTSAATRTPLIVRFWDMLHGSVCDIFLITVLSILCVLAFESPTIALAKLLLNKREPNFAKNN